MVAVPLQYWYVQVEPNGEIPTRLNVAAFPTMTLLVARCTAPAILAMTLPVTYCIAPLPKHETAVKLLLSGGLI